MNIVLCRAVLESTPEIPITEEQFHAAQKSRTALNAAFALEETYDLLLSNFLELEQDALCAAASSVVRNIHSYEDLFEVRSNSNRRVVNLLSAARLYLDHAPQHLADCASDVEASRKLFKQATAEQYDAQFSYRFMEALRNHVQHSGLAVHVIRHASRWTGLEPANVLETSLELVTEKKFLQEDSQFHKKTLAEMPDSVEILQASREYLQGLGQVHTQVRAILDQVVPDARRTLQQFIDTYASLNNGSTLGLSVMQIDGKERKPLFSILLNWDDVRLKLRTRNGSLGNLGRRFATGHRSLPIKRQ